MTHQFDEESSDSIHNDLFILQHAPSMQIARAPPSKAFHSLLVEGHTVVQPKLSESSPREAVRPSTETPRYQPGSNIKVTFKEVKSDPLDVCEGLSLSSVESEEDSFEIRGRSFHSAHGPLQYKLPWRKQRRALSNIRRDDGSTQKKGNERVKQAWEDRVLKLPLLRYGCPEAMTLGEYLTRQETNQVLRGESSTSRTMEESEVTSARGRARKSNLRQSKVSLKIDQLSKDLDHCLNINQAGSSAGSEAKLRYYTQYMHQRNSLRVNVGNSRNSGPQYEFTCIENYLNFNQKDKALQPLSKGDTVLRTVESSMRSNRELERLREYLQVKTPLFDLRNKKWLHMTRTLTQSQSRKVTA